MAVVLSIWIWMWQLFIWLQKHFNAKKAASNSNMFVWYSASEEVHLPPRFLNAKNSSPAQCWCVWLNCVAGVVVVDISFESWHYRATTEFLLYRERIIAFFSYNHPCLCLLWVRDIYRVQGGGSVRQVVHHCLKLKQNLHLIQNKDSQIVSHKCGTP